MDNHQRLQIANRIHLGLMRELGQGIDVKQMLSSTLYARDVLLVCRAYPGTELQRMAEQFRQVTADGIEQRIARGIPKAALGARASRQDSSGFGVSKPATSSAHSDFDSLVDSTHDPRSTARRWLTPSTWFAR